MAIRLSASSDLRSSAELAAEHAAKAAGRSGIELRLLTDVQQIKQATRLFADVWGTGTEEAGLPSDVVRALVHAGNYAAGAFTGDVLVGAVVAFLGLEDGELFAHSHILGVSAERRGANIGFALKQHQRAWALARGLRRVTWTFDPLVRRNAYFNLHKLGADVAQYHESFYGRMSDGINAGDESDRLVIEWSLDEPRVAHAAAGRLPELSSDDLVASGATVALSDEAGAPRTRSVRGDTVLCATPENIVALRQADVGSALRWRRALRDTLGSAVHDGYRVAGFTRSGWYVLQREDGDG